MKLPHINYGTDDEGRLFVSVEDTELFDYVEDHFIEKCNIEYEFMSSSESNSISIYTMYFSKSNKEQEIEEALSKLSKLEIERIYDINNPV